MSGDADTELHVGDAQLIELPLKHSPVVMELHLMWVRGWNYSLTADAAGAAFPE